MGLQGRGCRTAGARAAEQCSGEWGGRGCRRQGCRTVGEGLQGRGSMEGVQCKAFVLRLLTDHTRHIYSSLHDIVHVHHQKWLSVGSVYVHIHFVIDN